MASVISQLVAALDDTRIDLANMQRRLNASESRVAALTDRLSSAESTIVATNVAFDQVRD